MARIVYFCFGFFSIISTICAVSGMGVAIGCYSSTVKIYNGHQQTTKDGTQCVRWDSVNEGYKKSKHKFPDHTLSDANNYCRAMDKDILWCWKSSSEWDKCGIEKCDDISFVTNCGTLKIEQPTLLGRNVTFSFTPDSQDQNAILEWQRSRKPNPWYTRPLNYKFTQFYIDRTYYMILTNSVAKFDEVYYRIHYYNETTQCLMETKTELKLDDNPRNPCGFVYLRNEQVVEDKDIKLEYYPFKTSDFSQHYWVRYKDGQNFEIKVGDDINMYTEDEKENGMFELTIHTIKQNMNGRYGVRCGTNVGLTNNITITVLVPPSVPEFIGLQDIDGCRGCIVGYDKENIIFHCTTSGGTEPVKAKFIIGDDSLQAEKNNSDSSDYITSFTISTDIHHYVTITCSIMNEALSSPLTVSTKLFVIKSPTVALSVPDKIREGNSSDIITCIVPNPRPPPKVSLYINGTEVTSAYTDSFFTNTTFVYNDSVALKTFKREWNGKNITCCRYNKWYKPSTHCSEPKKINLLFPPSRNKLEIRFDSVDPLQMYAVCMVYNSNPVCMVKFMSARGILGSEISSRNLSLSHGAWNSAHTVNLNVREEDNGTNITCVVKCEEYGSIDIRDTRTIVIPYRSEIEFNTSESSLDISKGEVTYVKCLADSFPASNITWMEELDEGVIIKHQCDFESECVLDINADVISKRQFVCAIDYLLIHDNKTLSVNIYSPRKQDQLLIWIITGAGSALVLIGVILAIIIRNKRSNVKAKPIKNQTDHRSNSLPASGNREYDHQNENTYAADPMDVTYSQPIKNRKVSAEQEATYSVVNKVEKSTNQATTCTAKEQHSDEGQLTYIELDFDPNKSALKKTTANRRNSPTEYVAIDFVKTAAHVANEDDMPETDNIYANQ